ncbi:MAG: WecB/TagA/CpsF family glycosyltransferase [Candidatus Omnitrophota bacterium]
MMIFGTKCDNISISLAIKSAMDLVRIRKKATILFLNADCLYKALKDEEYKNIINSADLVLSDGIGLKFATNIFGEDIKDNCNGTDLSPLLMQKAAEDGYKIFFLGSEDIVAEKAAQNIGRKIAGIQIVGTHHGFFKNDEEVIKKINDSGADILFVAMGVPRQEKWIAKHREKLNPRLCLGVGALFDYLSGRIPRAPLFIRRIHLEWLWRIFIEPKRMIKRYIIDGTKLFWIILKCRVFSRNPSSTSAKSPN